MVTKQQWAVHQLVLLRREIGKLPKEVRDQIEEGERVIDEALHSDTHSWFGTGFGLNVFDLREKINPLTRTMLLKIYDLAGFKVEFPDRGDGTEPNMIIMS